MKYPEVRIKNAWLLRLNASVYLHELWADKGEKHIDDDKINEIIKRYKKAWKPEEEKIITNMCKILDLEFRQNTLDVYIAPWFRAFSDPLVIGTAYKSEEFVDLLTHEICHCLLTDNLLVDEDTPLLEIWGKMFGTEHDFKTLVHIPVHAICKYIYLDIRNRPDRLKYDIAISKKRRGEPYVKAWEYVEENDYKQIIKQLKISYKKLDKH